MKLSQTNDKCPYCGHLEGTAQSFCQLCLLRNSQQPQSTEGTQKDNEAEGKDNKQEGDKEKDDGNNKGKEYLVDVEDMIDAVPRVPEDSPFTPKAGDKWYQRMWHFEFVPLGFFGRLTVRILSQSTMTVPPALSLVFPYFFLHSLLTCYPACMCVARRYPPRDRPGNCENNYAR